MKRDLRKAEEEEKLRENANNRDQWKQITKVAVQPQGKPEEEQHLFAALRTNLWFAVGKT